MRNHAPDARFATGPRRRLGALPCREFRTLSVCGKIPGMKFDALDSIRGLIGLFVVVLMVAPSIGGSLAIRTRRLKGVASRNLTASIVSIRPIVHDAPGGSRIPAVTGGSGLARHLGMTLVAQDDSAELAAIAEDGRIAHVRLFDTADGRHRFHPAFGNKNQKPDIEAIVIVRASASTVRRLGGPAGEARTVPAILLFGSGSIRGVRDRMALVVPQRPFDRSFVRVAHATALYDTLRARPSLSGSAGALNIEAASSADGGATVRLYNRGNSGEGSVTASVDLAAADLLAYFEAAASDPAAPFVAPLRNPMQYDLGQSGGRAVTIGEAIALPSRPILGGAGAVLIAGIAEASANAIDDGATSGTTLGLQLADGRRLLVTPVLHDGKPSGLKIEGLAVVSTLTKGSGSSRRLVMRIIGVVDSDDRDPSTPSSLVEIDLTYRPI